MSYINASLLKTLVLSLLLASLSALRTAAAPRSDFDVQPVAVKTPPPDYPVNLKRDGVSGMVALKIEIDETGAVSACAVSKSSNPDFNQPAIDAVKNWKFKPAQKDGNPVKVTLVIPIRFSLDA